MAIPSMLKEYWNTLKYRLKNFLFGLATTWLLLRLIKSGTMSWAVKRLLNSRIVKWFLRVVFNYRRQYEL